MFRKRYFIAAKLGILSTHSETLNPFFHSIPQILADEVPVVQSHSVEHRCVQLVHHMQQSYPCRRPNTSLKHNEVGGFLQSF